MNFNSFKHENFEEILFIQQLHSINVIFTQEKLYRLFPMITKLYTDSKKKKKKECARYCFPYLFCLENVEKASWNFFHVFLRKLIVFLAE